MRKRIHLLMVQTKLIHFSKAIEMAIEQGKGWASSEEREKYLETLLDGEFIPPLFAENEVELEKSGLKDAFTTLHNEGEFPGKNMMEFKEKGNFLVTLTLFPYDILLIENS